uniref:Uncharacterized protein n=1 Tax=Arundo donax TaxID=35708 RepID=A0A0A9FX17_ARUDO
MVTFRVPVRDYVYQYYTKQFFYKKVLKK